jgi:hypothetical protein
MRNLDLPSTALAGLVAFYAIVHFELNELSSISRELRRVLVPGGLALVSFHAAVDGKLLLLILLDPFPALLK